MVDANSLEVYTTLFERLLLDIADCYTDSEPRLDLAKAKSRMSREGISFLTKSLPRLGKAFDKALQGEDAFLFQGFVMDPKTRVPKFLGWLFKRVFAVSGYVRGDPDILAIKHIRQLLFLLYKLELPYASETVNTVLEGFTQIDAEIKNLIIDRRDPIIKRARTYVTRLLSGLCHRDIIPRHGPGAVATGETGGEKSRFSRIYVRMEKEYPFTEYFHLSPSQTIDHLEQLGSLEVHEAGTAKVVLVPKDSRGPRLISCEPLENQWIQQGQLRKLVDHIERHWMTAGHVNFTNQRINRELALRSSKDGRYVTLDMKDASDRVSLQLVESLFSGTSWFQGLMASRSAYTRLPDGTVIALNKFAPMGSATCFPVEAVCFWALAVAVLTVCHHYSLAEALERVFVYGDDIILPREDYSEVMQHFPRFGLVFNANKCCVAGSYRESCGCDAFAGVDVTPIRLRTTWGRCKQDATELMSYVEFSNKTCVAGFSRTTEYIRHIVQARYGTIPYVEYTRSREESSQDFYSRPGRVIGFYDPNVIPNRMNPCRGVRSRFNRNLHRHEVYGWSVSPVHKHYRETGWEALLRSLTSGASGMPNGIYAVARCSRLKRRWGASGC